MGALDGLLVVAIEQAVAAPMCTLRLADAGARVIKIERDEGETARNYDSAVKGTSAYFAWLNRGKESAVLNLKDQEDFAVVRSMLAKADVFVQNLVPGAIDRLGLSPDEMKRDFPHLITVSIVGYGQDTPYANMRAYDMLVQAESGLCSVTGTDDTPSKIGVSAADIATGMNAHAAVLEAIIGREKTKRGQHIEIAMFDGIADWMAVPLLHYEHTGNVTGRYGLSHASIYPYRPFKCSDGTLIVAIQNNSEFDRFCKTVVHKPELIERDEFTNNSRRVTNRDALDAELEPVFAQLSLEVAIQRLRTAALAYGRYTSLDALPQHSALRRLKITLPDGQTATVPRPAGRNNQFSPGPVPALGAQTARIKAEFG